MTSTVKLKQAVDKELPLSQSMPVTLQYNDVSKMTVQDETSQLALACDNQRTRLSLDAEVKSPLMFRDCMRSLFQVVSSDYRYVPKDRAAYHAWRQFKRSVGSQSARRAQQAYFEWLQKNDPAAWLILDPVVTVHPDELQFEVFSKDEGSYARFSLDQTELEHASLLEYGTSNVDFSERLMDGLGEFRSYRKNRLVLSQTELALETESADAVVEKKIKVPQSWIRAFLQVQTAAGLPGQTFTMAAIDLYNVLRHLRLNADIKGKRRGIRVELVPGEYPRLVLEPWEKVFVCSAQKFQGKTASVTRVWGRRRLMMLQEMLAYADEIEVKLLGNALPGFWTLKSDKMSFTLGLTGYTSSNWSQALHFDLLLPRNSPSNSLDELLDLMKQRWLMSLSQLKEVLPSYSASELLAALQSACQQGWLMYDIHRQVYRYRPLLQPGFDQSRLEFRGRQDRQAHDLVTRKNALSLEQENDIYGVGTEIGAKVVVEEDRRDYEPFMLINEEGGVQKASCTCPDYRRDRLSKGPCAHLIALRIYYAQEQQKRNTDEKARHSIRSETRSLSKRCSEGERVYFITLDQHRIKKRWGINGGELRLQQLQFNSTDEARQSYLAQIEQLVSKGYLDLTAGK